MSDQHTQSETWRQILDKTPWTGLAIAAVGALLGAEFLSNNMSATAAAIIGAGTTVTALAAYKGIKTLTAPKHESSSRVEPAKPKTPERAHGIMLTPDGPKKPRGKERHGRSA